MFYKLCREVDHGKVAGLSLGVPEVDAYLRFLKYRCRSKSWISDGSSLQLFFNTVRKPSPELTPADILAFVKKPCGPPPKASTANR